MISDTFWKSSPIRNILGTQRKLALQVQQALILTNIKVWNVTLIYILNKKMTGQVESYSFVLYAALAAVCAAIHNYAVSSAMKKWRSSYAVAFP